MLEESKQHWIRLGVVALVLFLVSYLAFYMAMKHNLKRFNSPLYQAQRLENFVQKQEREWDRYNLGKMENPFEPKMRPMIANLVKESNEYKVIVDLKAFDGNENNIKVDVLGDELTIKGQIDKKIRGTEKIISFSQTYYLDEQLQEDKMLKEKKGDKYIITIPFKQISEEKDED